MAPMVLVKGSRGTWGLSSERAQCQVGCHSPIFPPGCKGDRTGQGCALLTHIRSSASRLLPALTPGATTGSGPIPFSSAPWLTCDYQLGPVALHHFIGLIEGDQSTVVGA